MRIKKSGINLKDTITSGQMFRYTLEEDESFTIVLKDRVINVKEVGDYLEVTSNKEKDLRSAVVKYFDLKRDYEAINKKLSKNDPYMKELIKKNKGYKILRQDPFEMLVSYIISQNNGVSRISNSVEMLSKKYGKKVKFNKKKYYLFPTPKKLRKLSYKQFRECGIGFRDKYVKDAVIFVYKNPEFLTNLGRKKTDKAIDALLNFTGIGMKVASCILLFGYGKLDVFPVDTWVKKNMSEVYPEVKNDIKSISQFAKNKYGEYSGLAIQYMFNASRNK